MEQSMVEREISVMRLVRHPNVVELKEVMEFKKDSTRHTSTSLSVPSIRYFVGGFLPATEA